MSVPVPGPAADTERPRHPMAASVVLVVAVVALIVALSIASAI